jgi:hypothetical protein
LTARSRGWRAPRSVGELPRRRCRAAHGRPARAKQRWRASTTAVSGERGRPARANQRLRASAPAVSGERGRPARASDVDAVPSRYSHHDRTRPWADEGGPDPPVTEAARHQGEARSGGWTMIGRTRAADPCRQTADEPWSVRRRGSYARPVDNAARCLKGAHRHPARCAEDAEHNWPRCLGIRSWRAKARSGKARPLPSPGSPAARAASIPHRSVVPVTGCRPWSLDRRRRRLSPLLRRPGHVRRTAVP